MSAIQVGNRDLLEASLHHFDYHGTSVMESSQLWKLVLEPLVSASNSHIDAEIDLCYYNEVIICETTKLFAFRSHDITLILLSGDGKVDIKMSATSMASTYPGSCLY